MKAEVAKREIESLDYYLQNHTNDYSEESHTAMMMAIKALEQKPCNDCISRQAAIDACLNGWNKDYKEIVKEIRALPPVTPLPKEEESKVMLSNLDRSMECVLESDHRSFSNRETENGWLFDHIIEWRKMIKPFIKEE